MDCSLGIRLLVCAAAAALWASPALGADPAPLPLTRVRLYETGVGYFERSGPLAARGGALPVPTSHLDDALKTLVVLSDDPEARIAGVEFSSSLSPGRARSLAGLPGLEDAQALGLSVLLRGLRGASVDVRARGASVAGRLVEVLDAEQSDLESCVRSIATKGGESLPCAPTRHASIVVLGVTGDVRRLRIDDIESVRPTEPEVVRRLATALDAASDRNARAVKELRLLARGSKNVTLGYVAETPIWRASYRLVLGATRSAKIQGYALLHNDTDEAWRGVRVEMVNGRPDSFLYPLAAPRYARRALVTPAEELSTLPQLGSTTPDQLWGDEVGEAYGFGRLGGGIGQGGGGRGEGIGLGSVVTLGRGVGSTDPSDLLALGNLAGVASATGVEAGALFRFTLPEPVDLMAHGSVLAPFVSDGIEAVRAASFDSVGSAARSAVRLTYRGTQTLPPGTIAVFDDGGFAGEALLQRTKPNETSLVVFGNDLDVLLAEKEHRQSDETRLLSHDAGALVEHFVRRHTLRYEIENRSGTEREVLLGLSFVNNTKVEGAEHVYYDAASRRAFASFGVKPRSVAPRVVTASEGLERRHDATTITLETLARLAAQTSFPEKQRKLVREAIALARERDAARKNHFGWESALNERNAEAERLRGHARAVGESASEDIVERLLEIEAETRDIRRHIAAFALKATRLHTRQVETLARL